MTGDPVSSRRINANFHVVEEYILEAMNRRQVPGVAVGILHDDEQYLAGFGVTDVDNPFPVTLDTLFQIGSVTKPIVATAVMCLVEMNKIDLDTPIRNYLHDFHLADETVAQRVTVRHLLTHTGGWSGDFWQDVGDDDDALAKYVSRMVEFPQMVALGEVCSYNNTGFSLLGRVVEVVTGMTFERAMQHLLFAPLGMMHTFFSPSEMTTSRFVIGHEIWDDVVKSVGPLAQLRSTYPASGIITCISDLLRFARFHLKNGIAEDGTQLLSEASVAAMQMPLYTRNQGWIGLGWEIDEINGIRVIGHAGITTGQISSLRLIPDRQFAVAFLTNGSGGSLLSTDVSQQIYQQYLEISEKEPTFLSLPEEELLPYVGMYDSAMSLTEVRLAPEGLVIISRFKGGYPTKETPGGPPGNPRRIAFYSKDRVTILDPPWKGSGLTFIRKPDGSIHYLQAVHLLHKIL